MEYNFRIERRPKVKERPRMGRRGAIYTPRHTSEYEEIVAKAYGNGPIFYGPVEVWMTFHKEHTDVTVREADLESSKLRGDIDNYAKAVLDGLNEVAFPDDRQVVKLVAVKAH